MRKIIAALLMAVIILGITYAQNNAGTALWFDGNNDWVEVPSSPSLNPTDAITVEVWARSDAFDRPQWQEFVMKGGNAPLSGEPRQYYLRPRKGDGKAQFNIHDSSDNIHKESSDDSLINGMWHHVAGTYDGNVLKIYIDGVLQGTDTLGTISIMQTSEVLAFGRLGAIDAEYYWGEMDEIRIWDVARTQAQLQATMNDTLGPEYYATADSGLVGYWRFDEGSGNTALDLTGNNNDGFIHGAVYVPSGAPLSVKSTSANIPRKISLEQNYPNPFNPTTVIPWQLAVGSNMELTIYNLLGQKIRTLVNSRQPAGAHQAEWDGRDDAGREVGSGIYIYRIKADDLVSSRKMLLI